MKKTLLAFLLFLFVSAFLSAQQKVTVDRSSQKRPDETNIIFTGKNDNHYSVTLLLEVQNARYRLASDQVPVVKKISGFSSQPLVTLFGSTNTPGYEYRWMQGCLRTKPRNVSYLIPLGEGKSTTVYRLGNISDQYFDGEAPEGWASFAFSAEAGDTIYAARRGTVIEVEDYHPVSSSLGLAYTAQVNSMKVEHEDCTIGYYRLFKPKSTLAAEGFSVEAGDALGIVAAGENYGIGTHLQFTVYYAKITRELLLKYRSPATTPFENAYIDPKFALTTKPAQITDRQSVTVSHPIDVITEEMSRSQVKKWKKKRQ